MTTATSQTDILEAEREMGAALFALGQRIKDLRQRKDAIRAQVEALYEQREVVDQDLRAAYAEVRELEDQAGINETLI